MENMDLFPAVVQQDQLHCWTVVERCATSPHGCQSLIHELQA